MKTKMTFAVAKQRAEGIVSRLKLGCLKIEIAGSIRREKSEIGDIEIVLVPKFEKRTHKVGLDQFLDLSTMEDVDLFEERLQLLQNQTQFRFGKNGSKYKELIFPDYKVDLFIADETNFGLILMIRTGSAKYSRNFMIELNKRGKFKVKDGYLWRITDETSQKISVPNEVTLYKVTGFPYRPPTERASEIF